MGEDGFYWVQLDADGEWTVGELENGKWWVIGSDDNWLPGEIAKIGPNIEKPK